MDNSDKNIFTFNDATNIVFFSSGDFGIPTLKALIEDKRYNVKGIVTSKDKVVYNDKRILDIAKENSIPCCIPSNEEELYCFLETIKNNEFETVNNLYYCVISYKKLSDRILSLVEGRAMNVHASILPFLRGAAPINWAIRLGFKQTGLTAFKLSDKIDCGDIITTTIVDIDGDDDYDSLFKKLSYKCADFTMSALLQYIATNISGLESNYLYKQPNIGVKSNILVAPKIKGDYWNGWLYMKTDEINRLFRSTPNGLPCKLYVVNKDDDRDFYEYSVKIWRYNFVPNEENYTDYKHYLNIPLLSQTETMMSIKEIQLEGKKRLDIAEFLRGFKYTRKGESDYRLEFSTQFD